MLFLQFGDQIHANVTVNDMTAMKVTVCGSIWWQWWSITCFVGVTFHAHINCFTTGCLYIQHIIHSVPKVTIHSMCRYTYYNVIKNPHVNLKEPSYSMHCFKVYYIYIYITYISCLIHVREIFFDLCLYTWHLIVSGRGRRAHKISCCHSNDKITIICKGLWTLGVIDLLHHIFLGHYPMSDIHFIYMSFWN